MFACFRYHLLVSILAIPSWGCGTHIPDMAFSGKIFDQVVSETDLINHIKCEIHLGAREALRLWARGGPAQGNGVDWLKSWQAKVSMKLTVDDTGTLNPGVSITEPMRTVVSYFLNSSPVPFPQSFALGIGLQASSQSVRTETLGFTYGVADLLQHNYLPPEANSCEGYGRVPIVGTLKINEFIVAKAGVAAIPDVVPNTGNISPFTTFQYETSFILTLGGNVTPTWRLVQFTANTPLPLVTAARRRTQYVSITMGPIDSSEVMAVYQSALTGQAVAAALQGSFRIGGF